MRCIVIEYCQVPYAMDIQNDIEEWYDVIGADLVEIVSGRINGHRVVVICDEDGKLKKNVRSQVTGFITHGAKPVSELVGTLIVAGAPDMEGNITSLPDSLVESFPMRKVRLDDGRTSYMVCLEA